MVETLEMLEVVLTVAHKGFQVSLECSLPAARSHSWKHRLRNSSLQVTERVAFIDWRRLTCNI